jgi:DNA mismatch repair protein MutL
VVAVRDSAASPLLPRPGVRWSSLSFTAQVRQTYLICESDDGLYLLDQHAASERVNFDRLTRAYRARMVPSQRLLFPVILEVSGIEAELADAHGEQIGELGLDVRVRSADAISVHAVPKLLQQASPERLVRDLLSELSRSGGRAFSNAVDQALATLACHGSLRAGDTVARDEATALLDALDHAEFAGHCPHGRPVVAFTSWAELERKVGRR